VQLRYKCLILDHDDTAVKSTPEIHYPAFVKAMQVLRPKEKPFSLEQFVTYSYEPGFAEMLRDIIKLTPEERSYQYQVWREAVDEAVPDFYEGFPELLERFKDAGGIITVVSHSECDDIRKHYEQKCNVSPDLIFGWVEEADKRKPSPYPVREILKAFSLKEKDALLLDDLKPGIVMAKSCCVPCAAAGWAHQIPVITEYMKTNADYYFSKVKEFADFMFA
jgi:phosphoglycolate phosphatase-like HAD superfamily hydrolase